MAWGTRAGTGVGLTHWSWRRMGIRIAGALIACASVNCAPPDPGEERADSAFIVVDPGQGETWTYPGQASGDGLAVVGFSGPSEANARGVYRWTAVGGLRGRVASLRPPGLDAGSDAGNVFSVGLSADAGTVIGTVVHPQGDSPLSLFYWNAGVGMLDLGSVGEQAPADIHAHVHAQPQVPPVRLSDDGRVVTATANGQAFRWSAAAGRITLGTLPGDLTSDAVAISADGGVIAGNSRAEDGAAHVFRWTAATGMHAVPPLVGAASCETFGQLSADGGTLFGRCFSDAAGAGAPRLFRWSASTGTELIDVPAPFANARPWAMTADGAVLVGLVDAPSSSSSEPASSLSFSPSDAVPRASALFRWIKADASVGQGGTAQVSVLTPPHGFGGCDWPYGLSADGAVVLGSCRSPTGAIQAVKWDRAGAAATLGSPVGFAESHPSSISADGQVVAGCVRQRAGTTEKDAVDDAAIWDARTGARRTADQMPERMIDRLRKQGLVPATNTGRLRLLSAQVAPDGHTFFGEALDPRGRPASWIARLP